VELRIDRASTVPASSQVRDRLIAAIARGRLLPGDRLPTVRALAGQLGLAPNTVARAYRELEEAGWVVGRGRLGTFVAETMPARRDDAEVALAAAADRFARRARQLGADPARALAEAVRALRVRPHDRRAD
jgi:GntR family transcriptional regulator